MWDGKGSVLLLSIVCVFWTSATSSVLALKETPPLLSISVDAAMALMNVMQIAGLFTFRNSKTCLFNSFLGQINKP